MVHLIRFDYIQNTRAAIGIIAVLAVIWRSVYSNLQPIDDWLTYDFLRFERQSHLGQRSIFWCMMSPKFCCSWRA